jgi:hypothetical protein
MQLTFTQVKTAVPSIDQVLDAAGAVSRITDYQRGAGAGQLDNIFVTTSQLPEVLGALRSHIAGKPRSARAGASPKRAEASGKLSLAASLNYLSGGGSRKSQIRPMSSDGGSPRSPVSPRTEGNQSLDDYEDSLLTTAIDTVPDDLMEMRSSNKRLSLRTLIEYVFAERDSRRLDKFMNKLCSSFKNGSAELLERSTANSFRYRLLAPEQAAASSKQSVLAILFQAFEENRLRLNVKEYSVGQTTLEQIFNQFAGGSENPEVLAEASGAGQKPRVDMVSGTIREEVTL